MRRLLAVLLVALLCGHQVAVAQSRAGDVPRSAAAKAAARPHSGRRELRGIETSIALPSSTASTNVTNKFIVEAAVGALIAWGVEKIADAALDAITQSGESSVVYSYSFEVKTSCNKGAATDGSPVVDITDSKGNSLQTKYLNNEGNDRELCAVDEYQTDSTRVKVLLNSDTRCQIYFYPAGDKPNWEPEYVKIYRATDDDTTKVAKFCNNNGVLVDEGWYTFDYCSD